MLKLIVFATILLFGVSAELDRSEPLIGRNCTPGEVGKPEIKWFFDNDRKQGYPFQYLGCGETNGREFHMLPMLMDYVGCPGFYKGGDRCQKDQFSEPGVKPIEVKCKDTHFCLYYTHGHGTCCSREIQERYSENQKAKCPSGYTAITNPEDKDWKSNERTLFGKKCSHNFCPVGTKCIDGEFEAYCCKRKPLAK